MVIIFFLYNNGGMTGMVSISLIKKWKMLVLLVLIKNEKWQNCSSVFERTARPIWIIQKELIKFGEAGPAVLEIK